MLAWFVARRYLALQRTRFIAVISVFCLVGVAIGVAALVVAMALMNGYQRDLKAKLIGANASIIVFGVGEAIASPADRIAEIEATPGVVAAALVLYTQGLAASEKNRAGAEIILKGMDFSASRRVTAIAAFLPRVERRGGILLGVRLARQLEVRAGDAVQLLIPSFDRDGHVVRPRSMTFTVARTFETGFHEYDSRWCLLPLADAQELIGQRGRVNVIEVRVADLDETAAVTERLDRRLGLRFAVTSWEEMNRQLFAALSVQQRTLFFVLGLIVAVSTFSILSTLVMLVHEKRRDIGILLAMGATPRTVRRVFVSYGLLLGMTGTAVGIAGGSAIAWITTTFRLLRFPPEIAKIYFVSSIPLLVDPRDLAVITAFTLGVTFVATWIPAALAARLDPVTAIRYE